MTPTNPADDVPENTSQPDTPTTKTELLTLAPVFEKTEHKLYVDHLLAGLRQPANRNIALTGPYGSGKSSILDKVVIDYPGSPENPSGDATENETDDSEKLANSAQDRKERVPRDRRILRVSISTLGPSAENEHESEDATAETTNRIQKELVKQLLYRVEPGEIPGKRFPQRHRPSRGQVALEAAGFAFLLTVGLWLFGVHPDLSPPGISLPWWLSAFVLFVIGAGAFSAARWNFTGKPIQQVSAAGASISFDKKTDSVFDKYLDEIVRFFEVAKTEVVIFEDLDRFNTPEIFDSLRELNSLLNESAVLRAEERTLHFVYAVKDSMFEKIVKSSEKRDGSEEPSESTPGDAAKSETDRANRTKFFELVVPVVPFLSSNNARDLLGTMLAGLQRPEGDDSVSRSLIDLVARHTTDMRLLRNIRNEFVVFAQRLLGSTGRAPGITADNIFALVAYKNFHMSDYEAIFHRKSKLDDLERARQDVVESAIDQLQTRKNDLVVSGERVQRQERIASRLGAKLRTHLAPLPTNTLEGAVKIDGAALELNDVGKVTTWRSIIASKEIRVEYVVTFSGRSTNYILDQSVLETLFSEAFEPGLWDEITVESLSEERLAIEQKINDLRGADFATLAGLIDPDDESEANVRFRKAITDDLGSDLARDLVRGEYINKYFAEYASVFYGRFIGVGVAKFFHDCVWPNKMLMESQLTADDVANVFEEAPADFLRSRSALNLDIVKHSLESMDTAEQETVSKVAGRRLRKILEFAIADAGPEGASFLRRAIRDDCLKRDSLVKALAELHWDSLFNEISKPDVGAELNDRITLTDTALQAISDTNFELDEQACTFLADNHAEFRAYFEGPENGDQSEHFNRMYELATRARLIVPKLRAIALPLAKRFIEDRAFDLTADNLRFALEGNDGLGLTLDRIRLNEPVWTLCNDDLNSYLDAIADETDTPSPILGPDILAEVLNDHVEGDNVLLSRLLASSAPEARLPDLGAVDEDHWGKVLEADRVYPDVRNLLSLFRSESVSTSQIGEFLKTVDTIVVRENSSEPEDESRQRNSEENQHNLAITLLNTATPDLDQAISFAQQLGINKDNISIGDLNPKTPGLLAKLLNADLVKDEDSTFEQFSHGGWKAIASGVQISKNFDAFMTPELMLGLAGDLLDDDTVDDGLKRRVLEDLDEYIPDTEDDHVPSLRAAARVASGLGSKILSSQLSRMARSGAKPGEVVTMIENNPDLTADEIVSVLGDLGGEWSRFTEQSLTEKFEVPNIDGLARVLRRCRRLSNGVGVRQRTQKLSTKLTISFAS